ncbi:MAG: hypothetical protein EU529_16615 [Promethearchaeota archaeon]|nr:MAG: hypothetical protein EU529_16615 [Candidatus Lokiarchaeota archaeon]
MNNWLIFINSKGQLDKINEFIQGNTTIGGVFFNVINGPLKCKNNRIIGKEHDVLPTLSFHTYNKKPIEELIKKRIANKNDLIQIFELSPEELASEEELEKSYSNSYIKKAKNFFSIRQLLDYLNSIDFKFKNS